MSESSRTAAGTPPALTVVLLSPDSFEGLRTTVRHLAAQTVRDQLELLFLAPNAALFAPDPAALAPFRHVRIVETGTVAATGPVRARGVREAAAPIVVFGEDHCFPDPEWAEALLSAHRGPWAAVGPVVRNANPVSAVSWADLLIGYGPFLEPGEGREMSILPGHNCSYKRDLLLALGDQLDALFDAESVLHWTLRARGHRLWQEPSARVAHTNFSRWGVWLPVQLHHGRVFADTRAAEWSWLHRAAFTAGSPLIPLVRFVRIWKEARASGVRLGLLLAVAPALTVGLVFDGLGQMIGYAMGAGGSRDRLSCFEFKRMEANQAGAA